MKLAKAVNIDKSLIKELDDALLYFIYKILFIPLKDALNISKNFLLQNEELTPLEIALKKGRIVYKNDVFTGTLNAEIVKELNSLNAIYLGKKSFFLSASRLPTRMNNIAKMYNLKLDTDYSNVLKALSQVPAFTTLQKTITNKILNIVNNLDSSIQESVKGIAIMPNLSSDIKRAIAESYTENLNLHIKNFIDSELITLRKNVSNLYFKGFRKEKLIEEIKGRYNVSKNKAKFLAKQEMGLLHASFTESRYRDAGVQNFQWTRTTSKKPDPYHASLVGKIFSLDDKPIINDKTGEKGLPKERYGCSCDMRPVFD